MVVQRLFKVVLNYFFQTRQVVLDHLPDSVEVDSQVIVDKHIPKTCDAPPGNLGVAFLEFFAQTLSPNYS